MGAGHIESNAHIKQATGEAEALRLRAIGEAEAIRATGQAKSEAYRAGVEALGAQGYTVMQLMQIVASLCMKEKIRQDGQSLGL